MGCKKLQLQDYFQLVENGLTKYCGARFNTYTRYNQLESKSLGAPLSKTSVPPRLSGGAGKNAPRQKDSLKGLSYSRTEYDYHVSGQIASATVLSSGAAGNNALRRTEYEWDGLALIRKNSTNYTNEPAVTGGNPILADNNVLFNDMLGTTLGVVDSGKISSIKRDAFGQTFANTVDNKYNMFTGKPEVEGLGYAFLFRNYCANLGKWQTADPLGYPDGWNNLAYVNNGVTSAIDWLGGTLITTHGFDRDGVWSVKYGNYSYTSRTETEWVEKGSSTTSNSYTSTISHKFTNSITYSAGQTNTVEAGFGYGGFSISGSVESTSSTTVAQGMETTVNITPGGSATVTFYQEKVTVYYDWEYIAPTFSYEPTAPIETGTYTAGSYLTNVYYTDVTNAAE